MAHGDGDGRWLVGEIPIKSGAKGFRMDAEWMQNGCRVDAEWNRILRCKGREHFREHVVACFQIDCFLGLLFGAL